MFIRYCCTCVFVLTLQMTDKWELYYHPLAGRGEFVRLLFVEAGEDFKDIDDADTMKANIHEGGLGGFPVQFPPVLRNGNILF